MRLKCKWEEGILFSINLHLWTFKTPTSRRVIGHRGNVTLDILNIIMPIELRMLLFVNIVIGFLYNLFYYIYL